MRLEIFCIWRQLSEFSPGALQRTIDLLQLSLLCRAHAAFTVEHNFSGHQTTWSATVRCVT